MVLDRSKLLICLFLVGCNVEFGPSKEMTDKLQNDMKQFYKEAFQNGINCVEKYGPDYCRSYIK